MTPELAPGQELAGFRIDAVAGRGPIGVVYRAEQIAPRRAVALRVISGELAADRAFRMRFRRANELAATVRHPNVAAVVAAGEVGDALFVATAWIEGETLAELVERDGPLKAGRAVGIVAQVAAGLDAARASGLVHRALSAANVQLDGDGRAVVGGFGLVRRVPTGIGESGTSQWLGEAAYAAPEQIRGGRVDGRADVYSLGCLLYELLAGRPPFERESDLAVMWAHTADRPPELPSPLGPVVAKALAKDRRDRFGTAAGLAAAAAGTAGNQADAGRPRGAAPDRAPRRRRARVPARALAVGAVVVAVAAGAWVLWPGEDGGGTQQATETEARGESCGEAPDVREVWAVAVDCRTAVRVAQEWSNGTEPEGFSCRSDDDGTRTCTSGIRRVTFVPSL
jgi:protein kinase-like protein